jgi:hypothetical protein
MRQQREHPIVQSWRVESATRTIRARFYIALLWFSSITTPVALVAVAIAGPGPHPGSLDRIGAVAFGVAGGALFVRGTRMRLELDDAGITIYGYFLTRKVRWSDIAAVRADYGGLRVVTKDGEIVTAVSLGKSNWSSWLKVRTRADRIVDQLRDEIAGRGI